MREMCATLALLPLLRPLGAILRICAMLVHTHDQSPSMALLGIALDVDRDQKFTAVINRRGSVIDAQRNINVLGAFLALYCLQIPDRFTLGYKGREVVRGETNPRLAPQGVPLRAGGRSFLLILSCAEGLQIK